MQKLIGSVPPLCIHLLVSSRVPHSSQFLPLCLFQYLRISFSIAPSSIAFLTSEYPTPRRSPLSSTPLLARSASNSTTDPVDRWESLMWNMRYRKAPGRRSIYSMGIWPKVSDAASDFATGCDVLCGVGKHMKEGMWLSSPVVIAGNKPPFDTHSQSWFSL